MAEPPKIMTEPPYQMNQYDHKMQYPYNISA